MTTAEFTEALRPAPALQAGSLTPGTRPAAPKTGGDSSFKAFGEDGFTFADFVDIINPLQHIPIVATVYRELTGDEIDPGARVAGGALFGGPIGAAAATVSAFLDETTGKDMGEHVLAFFAGDDATGTGTAIAAADEYGVSPPETVFSTAAGGPPAVPELGMLAPLPETVAHHPKPSGGTASLIRSADLVEISALAPLPPAIKPVGTKPTVNAAAVQAQLTSFRQENEALAALDMGRPLKTADTEDAKVEKETERATPPSGALAQQGGWFSDVMLGALQKYQASARLAESTGAQLLPVAKF